MPKAAGAHQHYRLKPATLAKLGPGRHADGGSLYLEVDASGARRWLLRARVAGSGKRRDIGLGGWPTIDLREARERARELLKECRAGRDPIALRDRDKRSSPTFEEAARHVFETRILPATDRPEGMQQWIGRLERHVFPKLGRRPIHTITQRDVLAVLEPIWLTKAETAKRVRQRMALIFDWAKTAEHVAVNPLDGIIAGLPKQRERVEHRTALHYRDVPAAMRKLEASPDIAARAARFAVLTATRTSEVRFATWGEIDLQARVWTIPGERMKMHRDHRVPLSDAAIACLPASPPFSNGVVFPGPKVGRRRTDSDPLSENAMNNLLEALDIECTMHGFRTSFRTWISEQTSYPTAIAEAALAHDHTENKTQAAYDRTDYFDRRVELMSD